jgi:hypothetical protein
VRAVVRLNPGVTRTTADAEGTILLRRIPDRQGMSPSEETVALGPVIAARGPAEQSAEVKVGKSIRLTARLPDGESVTLLNIPDWDLNWQEEYRFREMVDLPAGTALTSEIMWDNSSERATNPVVPPVRVRWGFESFDEMGSVDLLVVPQGPNPNEAMKKLRQSYREHLTWVAGSHVLSSEKLTVFGKMRHQAMARFDRNGDGILGHEEREEAEAALRTLEKADPRP